MLYCLHVSVGYLAKKLFLSERSLYKQLSISSRSKRAIVMPSHETTDIIVVLQGDSCINLLKIIETSNKQIKSTRPRFRVNNGLATLLQRLP